MPLYADDPDVNVEYPITDRMDGDLTWSPVVKATPSTGGAVVEVTGSWQGDPGPTRNLRVPLASLDPGMHRLRLVVPGDNDVSLGNVVLV